MEDQVSILSTFFLTNDTINNINTNTMSSKSTKKSIASKSNDLFSKKGAATKKDALKKAATKKKQPMISSDESSSEQSSSEDEPPKKSSKKKVAEKKSKKKPVTSSDESSSDEESEDEIVVETVSKKEVAPVDDIAKLNDGLLAIAAQFAASNANQTKILEILATLFAKMEVRNAEKEIDDDLFATIDDVVTRGETIVIGNKGDDAVIHHFESVGHLRQDSGQLATKTNFSKIIDALQDDVEEEERVDNSVDLA
ncbi:hypothetical protein BGX28_005527 [Mortierella sp. GBA30]|nr:hypothetical protein BGX28_005527 [Mortierella sp. GBA30]